MRVRHVRIAGGPGEYAGWPANHGAWAWGDELLAGYASGRYDPAHAGMHRTSGGLVRRLARSRDGGATWAVEWPDADLEGEDPAGPPPASVGPRTHALRVCGHYDHGGEAAPPGGALYASADRGATWGGPWELAGMEREFDRSHRCTARTCVHGDLVFLARARFTAFGTDEALCCRMEGGRLRLLSVLSPDGVRCLPYSAARAHGHLWLGVRQRAFRTDANWVSVYASTDGGESWCHPPGGAVGTGEHNGSPPALAALGGQLYMAVAHRGDGALRLHRWSVRTRCWAECGDLRRGCSVDSGYPVLLPTSRGLACVHYWSEGAEPSVWCTLVEGVG